MKKRTRKEKNKSSRFFIHKGDTKGEILRKIVFFISLIVFVATATDIAFYYLNPLWQQKKLNDNIKDYHSSKSFDYYSDKINPKFLSLYKKNKDIIGWISIDNTNIDYPVMQSKEEEYYLRRGFDKEYSREGSIFSSNASSIKFKKETKNIVLYGHNMTSTGTMFRQLEKYLDLKFYKKHPNITFDSLYRDGEYKIFAVFITNAIKSQDNGNIYDYQKTEFSTNQEFAEWINEARTRSVIKTDVSISKNDEILTLQTCNQAFESDDEKARLIIMARRIRQGEDKTTDTSKARLNPNPKYPQIWYDVNKLENPYLQETNQIDTQSDYQSNSSNNVENTSENDEKITN